jgi:hypothetical protein
MQVGISMWALVDPLSFSYQTLPTVCSHYLSMLDRSVHP